MEAAALLDADKAKSVRFAVLEQYLHGLPEKCACGSSKWLSAAGEALAD